MRVWGPPHIHWGYSPWCSTKRLLTTDRFGNADVGPPPEPGEVVDPNADPFFSNVVLLVGSESGFNIDESIQKPKGNGGGGVSTNAKFGTYSIDPATGLISYNGANGSDETDDFNLSPTQMSEFTIEAWVYMTVDPATTAPMTVCGKSFTGISWAFITNTTEMRFAYQVLESGFGGHGNFTNIITTGANLVANKWFYVAIDKDAAKNFRMYVGDPSVDPAAKCLVKFTPNDATISNFWVESVNVGEIGLFGTNNWLGQIDELRITKGQARYKTDSSFLMPTGPFPRPRPPTKEDQHAESLREDAR